MSSMGFDYIIRDIFKQLISKHQMVYRLNLIKSMPVIQTVKATLSNQYAQHTFHPLKVQLLQVNIINYEV